VGQRRRWSGQLFETGRANDSTSPWNGSALEGNHTRLAMVTTANGYCQWTTGNRTLHMASICSSCNGQSRRTATIQAKLVQQEHALSTMMLFSCLQTRLLVPTVQTPWWTPFMVLAVGIHLIFWKQSGSWHPFWMRMLAMASVCATPNTHRLAAQRWVGLDAAEVGCSCAALRQALDGGQQGSLQLGAWQQQRPCSSPLRPDTGLPGQAPQRPGACSAQMPHHPSASSLPRLVQEYPLSSQVPYCHVTF
jgi:hypothetical protein